MEAAFRAFAQHEREAWIAPDKSFAKFDSKFGRGSGSRLRSYFARNLGAARRPFRFRKNAPFVLHETLPKPVLRKPSERVHAAVLWGENCDCRMCVVFYQDRAVVGLRNALRDLNGGGEAPSNVIEVGNCTEMTTFHNFVLSDWLPQGTGRIILLENFSQFGHTLHEITK